MALSCGVTLNYGSYSAGQSPPPTATITVYNPNAVAVVVTSCTLTTQVQGQTAFINATSSNQGMPATGPGQLVTVPALGSINFTAQVVVDSAANANAWQSVAPTSAAQTGPLAGQLNLTNPQLALPASTVIAVGAVVTGSDGSTNVAGTAPLIVSYYPAPPLGYQGGFAQFSSPNNAVLLGVI